MVLFQLLTYGTKCGEGWTELNLFPVEQLSTVQYGISFSYDLRSSMKICLLYANDISMENSEETSKQSNCDCIWLKAHLIIVVVVCAIPRKLCSELESLQLKLELLKLQMESKLELPFASSTLLRHRFRFVFNNHLQMSIRPAPSLHLSLQLSLSLCLSICLTSISVAHAQRISKETNRRRKRN